MLLHKPNSKQSVDNTLPLNVVSISLRKFISYIVIAESFKKKMALKKQYFHQIFTHLFKKMVCSLM